MFSRKRSRVYSFEPYRLNGQVLNARADSPVNVDGLEQFITDEGEAYEIVVRYTERVTVEPSDHLYPGGTYVDIELDDMWLLVGPHRRERRVELPRRLQDAVFEACLDEIAEAVEV